MPALYLTEADVNQLLDMSLAIEVVEEAFRQLADGKADNVPRCGPRARHRVAHDERRGRLSRFGRLEVL